MWTKNILVWFIHPKLKNSALDLSRAKTIASAGIIAKVEIRGKIVYHYVNISA